MHRAMAMASSWRKMSACTSRDREGYSEREGGAGMRGTPADDIRAWAKTK